MPAATNCPGVTVCTPFSGLPEGPMRTAAYRWQCLFQHKDAAYMARLAGQWETLLKNKSARKHCQRWYCLFSFCAGLAETCRPGPNLVMAAALLLLRFPQHEAWQQAQTILSSGAAERDGITRIGRLSKALAAQQRARTSSGACFATLRPVLERLRGLFLEGHPLLCLQADRRFNGSLSAATDGLSILLPERINIAADYELNYMAYIYLLAHEAGHITCGSFDFSFRSEIGRKVWQRLAVRRPLFFARRSQAGVAAKHIKGENVRPVKPGLSHIGGFFMHFKYPSVAETLFNMVEDIRVDAAVKRQFSILGDTAAVLTGLDHAVATYCGFDSLRNNFWNAMGQIGLGLPLTSHIGACYRFAFDRVAALFNSLHRAPTQDVAQSVEAALDLYEALEELLPESAVEAFSRISIKSSKRPVDSIAANLTALRNSDAAERYDQQPVDYPDLPEACMPLPGEWLSYPEFDSFNDRVLPDAVRLQVKPWKPLRHLKNRGQQANGSPAFQFSGTGSSAASLAGRYTDEGLFADPERLHDLAALRAAGRQADGLVFEAECRQNQQPVFSVLIDLSRSMENRGHDGRRLLDRALLFTSMLAASAHHAGIPCGVFGLQDFGRRSITLWAIKDYSLPYDPACFATVHSTCFGGFRHAAGVRHLVSVAQSRFPGRRHIAIILMDTGSHYFCPGTDKIGDDYLKCCATCGKKCPQEPEGPCIGLSVAGQNFNMFYPLSYELADLRHAATGASDMAVFPVLLGPHHSPQALDRELGQNRWARVLDDSDILPALNLLKSRIIANAPNGRGK